ncbi:head-tail adaptor protein [Clostridium sp. SYSU_GA19001]|uniref:head-tail adaptor protein n=1 Tax=Clostridium caldaquaticum TaxID=2940653 RepID=UPI0020772CC0|nr:head-tail adaptor protein [Clostridium caldaquaticum]MCM8710537.1 head-tail adaptor protein [Clostridium caldaquaticum]
MDTLNCLEYTVYGNIQTFNGIGGFIETPIELFKIKGYLDLLSGNELTTNNTFMEESSHILLTDYRQDIKSKEHWIVDEKGNHYNIILVDDPLNLHHHLEVYLKFVGNKV